MTDAQMDRRLRAWLADREPGPVPPSLRDSAARVPQETPTPTTLRAWQMLVRGTGPDGGAPAARLVLLLAVVGLIAAAALALFAVGSSRQPAPVPGLTSWASFAVGKPAPPIVMRNVAGTPAVGDDETFEFDDRVGSVVVVYVAADTGNDGAARDVATFIATRDGAAGGAVFVVATAAPESNRGAISIAADAGIGAVQLPPSWATGSARVPDAAFVVIDRRGRVAAALGGGLPGPDQLIAVIDREVEP
jgi:hypothetical protein